MYWEFIIIVLIIIVLLRSIRQIDEYEKRY